MTGAPVLVVDDDMVTRHVLGQALRGAGLEYVAVASGAEALAAIDKVKPSIVLLDLVMPAPDGYQVLRILRARAETRELPVVVLTGLEADEEIARAFESGADDFVRKPFKAVELVARVRGQLRLRAAMEQLARRERDAQLVLELTQALASNLDFRSILFTVVQRLAEVAQVDRVSVVLVREAEDVGYVVAASDDDKLRDLALDLKRYPEIRQVLTTGASLVIEDATTHPLLELARAKGSGLAAFASICILPILYEGRPLGVLFLRSRRPESFREREVAVCRTVASAMAIALRNARVLQSLRDETKQVTVARVEAERRTKFLERYLDYFDSSLDGIVVLDAEGRLLFANPKALELTGFQEDELRSQGIDQVFRFADAALPEDARPRFGPGFATGPLPKDLDVPLVDRQGRSRVASISFANVLREGGSVLCSFRDVTKQRAVEAELVKTKDSLRRVIDASADAIVSCDMRGTVLLFNHAAEVLFGRASEEVVGTDVRGLYPEGTAKAILAMIRAGGGRVEGVKIDILNAAGTQVPVLFSGALIHEGKTAVGSVGVFSDLREKMRMERRLQQAQDLLISQERQAIIAELAGAAAHELNQPLTSVLNYATLLRRNLERGTSSSAAAEVIEGEALRMAEIVRKIGKITKYETKSYVGKQKILDLDRASDSSEAPQLDLERE